MTLVDTKKATDFFRAKLDFTTGPFELHEMIRNNENINIIDVRSAEDFDRGHIPGAMSLPEGTWRTTFGLSKDSVNVIYCYSEACHLAAHAAKYFAEHRFPVMELEGGFEEWERHNLPIVQ